jgi:prepilin-type N-terminal cleavage/methylation domain-containing protein
MKKIKKENFYGFTLMELLVALMVFTTAIILFSQIYIRVLQSERIAYGYLNNVSSLEYAIDFLTREARMGTSFSLPNSSTLIFNNRNGKLVKYYLSNNQIFREVDSNKYPITPLGIKINNLVFSLAGSPPLRRIDIEISFSTEFKKEGFEAQSTMKTSVTPRIIYTIVNR